MRLEGLIVGYEGRAVAGVPDLDISADRVWVVCGPNGSGKTTLLKTLAGLLPPISGSIAPEPSRGPGGSVFVHSTPMLFRGTVRSNLMLASDASTVEAVAQAFGLTEWLDRPVDTLSHGFRQRTSIARAVARTPSVLLLDEPEGGLDESATRLWTDFVQKAVSTKRTTIILAAHRPQSLGVPTQEVHLAPIGDEWSGR